MENSIGSRIATLKWLKNIFKETTLPQCLVTNTSSERHVFIDASKGAYGVSPLAR